MLHGKPALTEAIACIASEESGLAADATAELAGILQQLGAVADRFDTSVAALRGPLPRFMPVRDILRINFNMHAMVPVEAVPQRAASFRRAGISDPDGRAANVLALETEMAKRQ